MSLIERDLAIRAIAEDILEMTIIENPDTGDTVEDWMLTAESILSGVPSAQPEIIRCKDCKHSEHWYRDKRRCFLWVEDGIGVFDDGFCNYAEGRTDGNGRD